MARVPRTGLDIMAADRDSRSFRAAPGSPLRRLLAFKRRADTRPRRCAVCCGHAICLRCGGRGQVLVVPMGWQLKPYIEGCPDCEGSGACVECGAAALN